MVMGRYAAIGNEATYGTPAATKKGIRVHRFSVEVDRGAMYDESIESYFAGAASGGPLKVGGRLEMSVYPLMIGEVLMALFGEDGYTYTNSNDLHTHEFTLSDPSSVTLRLGENNVEWELAGCGFTGAEFTFEAKEFVKFSTTYIAKDIQKKAYSEPSFASGQPFVFWNARLQSDGVTVDHVEKVTVSIDRSLKDDVFVLDSFKRDDLIVDGVGELGGTITVTEKHLAELEKAVFGEVGASSIGSDNPLFEAHLQVKCEQKCGGQNCSLEFDIPVGVYVEGSWEITGRDYAAREIPYRILGSDFKATLKNTQGQITPD